MSAPDSTEAIRVLLVDDQDLVRTGTKIILDAAPDLTVVGEAANGFEAISLVDRCRPDVVLMDMQMPEMDGAEATRQVLLPSRAQRRERPVRVIVLTTFEYRRPGRRRDPGRCERVPAEDRDAATACRTPSARSTPATRCSVPTSLLGLLDATFGSPRAEPEVLRRLTPRERAVFDAVSRGLSNAEIADESVLERVHRQDPRRRRAAQARAARPGADSSCSPSSTACADLARPGPPQPRRLPKQRESGASA
ncbi:response regulator transcription factor [Nocardioides convexus]|uniref:response regulator transcription factor n=1 Tax=Nocardioides convexus TaxID=2712224 RepID=UPI003100AC84